MNRKKNFPGNNQALENDFSNFFADFASAMGFSPCPYDAKYIPERILKSGKATVVFWKDGTKTVVKCAAETVPNDYDAFNAALAIKVFGSNNHLKKTIAALTVEQKPKGEQC